ncbi:myb-like protein I isoform X1 [Anastrepha obliqua]|uniref:myb-like protein I isoform X1 n=1 Tax=Anastrepha obliqua TaxID=95512 RepID=UPI00240A80D0|nr:myb-like protein I isoform X1 [Anastrepha obliqua]
MYSLRNSSLFLLLTLCVCLTLVAVTFQQTQALRRIKRGSTGAQNNTKLTNGILTDQRNISNDIKLSELAMATPDKQQEVKDHTEHAWAKKAVAAVGHAIDKAFASLSHKSNEEKSKKNAQPNHSPSQFTNSGQPKPGEGSIAAKDLHKSSLAYLLNHHGLGERFFDDMQHETRFGAGEGAAEVLIIDNGLQPMLDMQHGLSSFAFHQPNLRSIANSFKRFSEISKESKLNNLNALKINTDQSGNNAGSNSIASKLSNDNGISAENGNKDETMPTNNKLNDNHNNSGSDKSEDGTGDSRKRNNDHFSTAGGDNGKAQHNSNNSNNDALIGRKSHHANCLQPHSQQLSQQQLQAQHAEVKESFPTPLSLSHKSMDGNGVPNKLQEESQGQQQRLKQETAEEAEQQHRQHRAQAQALAQTQPDKRHQQVQVAKHSSGKMLPMESFLKFANMMLYKMGPDGPPIHAQGAQITVNGNPTTSVISIGPAVEGADDADALDYLYNSLDPQLNIFHNPTSPGTASSIVSPGNTALLSRPFLLPSYSMAGPTQPINFIESALDLLLNAEDEGNDEMELVCPIHHPKKKSSENTGDSKDKDGVIQVCSCRFFKKNKNA